MASSKHKNQKTSGFLIRTKCQGKSTTGKLLLAMDTTHITDMVRKHQDKIVHTNYTQNHNKTTMERHPTETRSPSSKQQRNSQPTQHKLQIHKCNYFNKNRLPSGYCTNLLTRRMICRSDSANEDAPCVAWSAALPNRSPNDNK